MRILMVVTSHYDIDGKPKTGIWFNEFSEPFEAFRKADAAIDVASPRGGPAPIDVRAYPTREQIADVRDALAALNATMHLEQVRAEDYDGIFFPGGHGPMFDLAGDARTKQLVAAFWTGEKPVAAVCHGPAALLSVPLPGGSTLLAGRTVTGFSHGEDAQDKLFAHMPFALQDRMTKEGARFVEKQSGSVHIETDGRLVTGQNPASAEATADAFLALLRHQRR